jgi:hypothetical protein
MEITRKSKLFDVLEAYPFLEAQIVNIAPPFQNLKNPVLRRAVGKLATLEAVAQIGGMDVTRLVNTLRRAVGQDELAADSADHFTIEIPPLAEDDPSWIAGEPQFIVNGIELLKRGEVPLGKVNELLSQLDPERYILLITDFEPSPIIEAMHKQNRQVYHRVHPQDASQRLTYIG